MQSFSKWSVWCNDGGGNGDNEAAIRTAFGQVYDNAPPDEDFVVVGFGEGFNENTVNGVGGSVDTPWNDDDDDHNNNNDDKPQKSTQRARGGGLR